MKLIGIIKFSGRYIAEPYWPERAEVIDIDKQSGVSRARSESARAKALDAHLRKINMSSEQFNALQKRAARPFHTAGDLRHLNGHDPLEIVIPEDRIISCFVQGCDTAPSALRIAKPDQLRSVVRADPVFTGKLKQDGLWERAVVPKKDGKPLSNQRGTRKSAYIEDFEGELILLFEEYQVAAKRMQDFVEWTGREIGIGASRKMNCGRFTVDWKK